MAFLRPGKENNERLQGKSASCQFAPQFLEALEAGNTAEDSRQSQRRKECRREGEAHCWSQGDPELVAALHGQRKNACASARNLESAVRRGRVGNKSARSSLKGG